MEKQYNYILKIKELYHGHVKVSQPAYLGKDHPIYIVETKQDKTVFRFSDKDTAFRNFHISKILRKYNIPVPDIQIHRIDGKYCEIYPFIEGKTLYERHNEGISDITTKKIFTQICDICYRMAQIPVKEVADLNLHICKSDIFFKFMNKSKRVIGHCDLNDKNILLDKNDNVCAILDLDDICLKTFELILISLFECAKEKGYDYDVESIKEFFPEMYHGDSSLNIVQQNTIYRKFTNIKGKVFSIKHILQPKAK